MWRPCAYSFFWGEGPFHVHNHINSDNNSVTHIGRSAFLRIFIMEEEVYILTVSTSPETRGMPNLR